jgi:hypothetical protein
MHHPKTRSRLLATVTWVVRSFTTAFSRPKSSICEHFSPSPGNIFTVTLWLGPLLIQTRPSRCSTVAKLAAACMATAPTRRTAATAPGGRLWLPHALSLLSPRFRRAGWRCAYLPPSPLPTREQKVNTPPTAAFVRTSSLRVHLCTARPGGAEVGLGWHA